MRHLILFIGKIFARTGARSIYCRRENQYRGGCPLGGRLADCPLKGDCQASTDTGRAG